jgi:hypothetical protein
VRQILLFIVAGLLKEAKGASPQTKRQRCQSEAVFVNRYLESTT